jgi:ribulose-phosphate 3-epimerase
MSATICPTVTTDDNDIYRQQIEQSATYATRIHIDLADGIFTRKLTAVEDVWWPAGMRADLHIMFQEPFQHIPAILALGPQLVIVHAEADGDFIAFAREMHRHGIEAGVSLLQSTPVEAIVPALEYVDHVLIFSGDLGHFGGKADLSLLDKVKQLKQLKPQLEIGWDGGANDENALAMAQGGVDVINCGGYLHGDNPIEAYQKITAIVNQASSNNLHLPKSFQLN